MSSTEIVIDASGALLGRLASYAAKQALLGKKVIVVNCEKAVVSGSPSFLEAHYLTRRVRGGSSLKGPNFPRSPERILKRTIRGMLPYRQMRGLDAFKRVRCYLGLPETYQQAAIIRAGKEKPIRTVRLEEISKKL